MTFIISQVHTYVGSIKDCIKCAIPGLSSQINPFFSEIFTLSQEVVFIIGKIRAPNTNSHQCIVVMHPNGRADIVYAIQKEKEKFSKPLHGLP